MPRLSADPTLACATAVRPSVSIVCCTMASLLAAAVPSGRRRAAENQMFSKTVSDSRTMSSCGTYPHMPVCALSGSRRPLTSISPPTTARAGSRPASTPSALVLPQPEGPINAVTCECSIDPESPAKMGSIRADSPACLRSEPDPPAARTDPPAVELSSPASVPCFAPLRAQHSPAGGGAGTSRDRFWNWSERRDAISRKDERSAPPDSPPEILTTHAFLFPPLPPTSPPSATATAVREGAGRSLEELRECALSALSKRADARRCASQQRQPSATTAGSHADF
mmetsp:Transcript_43302/g.106945  ORF Transcript_43302/g.106945 Transcript_43302/m.106945 type:complete len:283 (+) Transcript_43302:3049-3897(+)